MNVLLNKILCLIIFIGFLSCGEETLYSNDCEQVPKYYEKFDLPLGLKGYNNYEQALECAKITNKPIAIYFRSKGCKHCPDFEKRFLSKSNIKATFNEEFVFISLSVNDETQLPEKDWCEYKNAFSDKKRKVRTIGHLNCSLLNKYNHSSHPSLFIAENTENIIEMITYHEDIDFLTNKLNVALNELE